MIYNWFDNMFHFLWFPNYGTYFFVPRSSKEKLSLEYNPPKSHMKFIENKGNDHQLKRLLIVRQILQVSTLGNV